MRNELIKITRTIITDYVYIRTVLLEVFIKSSFKLLNPCTVVPKVSTLTKLSLLK